MSPVSIGELLSLASSLGRAIAEQPRFLAVRDAEARVLSDPESRSLTDELERLRKRIASRESKGEEGSTEELQALRTIEERVRAEPKLQHLARAQADFAQMMNEVQERLYKELRATLREES